MGYDIYTNTSTARYMVLQIGNELTRDVRGLDRLVLDASLSRLHEQLVTLTQQNADLAARLDDANRATARAEEAKAAAESREIACHQLIEDLVTHFHQRDRRVSEALSADRDYSGLLSRAVHIEQAMRNGLRIASRAAEEDSVRSA